MAFPYTQNADGSVTSDRDWTFSGTVTVSGNLVFSGVTLEVNDDDLFTLGSDNDIAMLNRSTILATNTALTGVLIGTPVTPAVAANSMILANQTASGDFLVAANRGGNSYAWLWIDSSASLMTLFADGVSAAEFGTAGLVVNEAAADRDFRIEGDNNANMFIVDAGTDSASLGAAVVAGAFLTIDGSAVNRAGVTSVGRGEHMPAATFTQTNADPTTLAIGSRVHIGIPTFAGANPNQTISDAAALYIAGAAAAGTNMTLTRTYSLWVDAGAVRFDGTAYIGDDSNANITLGLTINQAGNDDGILGLKSSDVAHGFTTLAETDTYADFRKASAADGGLMITALADGTTTNALLLRGVGTAAGDTTHSTSGRGMVEIYGTIGSGTDVTNFTADANVLAVRTRAGGADVTRFMLDSDGDSHQDVGTAWTNFDDHDDLTLLNSLAHQVARKGNEISQAFGQWLGANRKRLEELKLVSFNDAPGQDGRPFVNMSKLTMLLVGATRQMGQRLAAICSHLKVTFGPDGKLLPESV